MRALVVRRKTDNTIEAFGPDNGNYAPGYDDATCVLSRENDYAAVAAEWNAQPKPIPPKQAARTAIQAYLDGTMTARDAIASIKDAL